MAEFNSDPILTEKGSNGSIVLKLKGLVGGGYCAR